MSLLKWNCSNIGLLDINCSFPHLILVCFSFQEMRKIGNCSLEYPVHRIKNHLFYQILKENFGTSYLFRDSECRLISRKSLCKDVNMNQWEFHNALVFYGLITIQISTTHTENR